MGIYVNPDEELLKMSVNSRIYVDKSMILNELNQVLNTEERFVCVARPRRFGKSMAGMVIKRFIVRHTHQNSTRHSYSPSSQICTPQLPLSRNLDVF